MQSLSTISIVQLLHNHYYYWMALYNHFLIIIAMYSIFIMKIIKLLLILIMIND